MKRVGTIATYLSTVTDQDGTYVVNVYTGSCFGSDTVVVSGGLLLDLDQTMSACPRTELMLTVPMQGTAYLWATGSVERYGTVYDAGKYPFTVWDDLNCPHTDTITVVAKDPDALLFVPNAFPPDGDGYNDTWIITGYGEGDTELMIFDRWGEKLYGTQGILKPWDGTFNGTPVKNDLYIYRLQYNAECAPTRQEIKYGHVMVVR